MSELHSKLKSNKKSYSINIIAIIVMFVLSIGIFSMYPLIRDISKHDSVRSSPYEDYNLLRKIHKSSYVLYKNILEKQQVEEVTYDKVYIKDGIESGSDYTYETMAENINQELGDWEDELNYNLKNLDYLVIDKDGNALKTNSDNNLNALVRDSSVEKVDINNLKEIYAWYMVVHFDESGMIEVNNVHGADEYEVRNRFSEYSLKREFNYFFNEGNFKLIPIKNTTFIYAIPKELKYDDYISRIINSPENNANWKVILSFVAIVFISILFLSLLVPYRKGKEVLGINKIVKIPLEINFCLFSIVASLLAIGTCNVVLQTLEGTLGTGMVILGINPQFDSTLRFSINIGIWCITFYFIFAGAMLLKYIFTIGLIQYLKENLLIIKLFRFAKSLVNKSIDYIVNIDLTDKSNKFIIRALIVNFVILSLISCIWFFGIGAAFIYTIGLFILLKKYSDDIKNKFSILLKATNKIADGNLDVEINEDLGLFNPFKEQLQKIQKGFKKAVNEEVKSQKMKTELISNVSHDLKTPLTSIITYVDLLKNENITEEERKSYIDTLDKKSQRLKFLIEDLFEVSKATSGDIKLNLVNIDIVELMRQTQIELADKIKGSNLIVRNNFPGNKIILTLDSQKTFRIFENLLINVIKYAMEGSRVYIDIIDRDESVEVTIKNISADEINFNSSDIVERFERGDKSRNTEGSGLGLAISKSFVEAQGGTFKIEIDGDLFKVIITFKK